MGARRRQETFGRPKRLHQRLGPIESALLGNWGIIIARLGIAVLVGLASVSWWLVQDKARDLITNVKLVKQSVDELSGKFVAFKEHEIEETKRVDDHASVIRDIGKQQTDQEHRLTVLEGKVDRKGK